MDKRIIILIVVFVAFALGFFVYRKMYYKHDGIRYEVRPRGIIKVADSIAYQDLTPGATRWKWDFGDGEYSSEQFGSHTYLEPGQFNVRLTVYGPFGVLQDSRAVVNVIPGELIAEVSSSEPQIVGPQDPKTGQQARYASSINAASYEWTVEGDPALAARRQSGSSAEYSFGRPGRRTLVLTMHNPDHVVRKDINVLAAAVPQPAAAAQPQQSRVAPVTRTAPMRQPPSQPKKGSSLPELGEGVEYEKK